MIKKICGITDLDEAEMVASYFPDYMGFVFHRASRRNISLEKLAEISDNLRVCFGEGCPKLVGVFVNPKVEFIEKMAPFLDVFQFHGEESPEFCVEISEKFPNHIIWKALRIAEISDLEQIHTYAETGKCDGILLDSFSEKAQGGTGTAIPKEFFPEISQHISVFREKFPEKIILMAGGISLENFMIIYNKTGASGVDMSSSLESKNGKKSGKKVSKIFCG